MTRRAYNRHPRKTATTQQEEVDVLGEKIGEFSGPAGTSRVLRGDDYRYVKIEQSWQHTGTLLGMDATNMATITSWERVPGQGYAEGQGIIMTTDGEGAIYETTGIATFSAEGRMSIRFSATFQASGNLAPLNGYLVIGEAEADADGNQTTTLWEWK